LGVPSLQTIWAKHTYELAGFKELLGSELSERLAKGESPALTEFPPLPPLTLNLKEHEPYKCLEGLHFIVTACRDGIVTLETRDHVIAARLDLNFPAESLEFSIEEFAIDFNHWRITRKQIESFYNFYMDYLANGRLQVFDSLTGDRLSHKLNFIPMNIDLRATFETLKIQELVQLSRHALDSH